MMSENDDNEYYVPLQDQRVFSAGIRRKGVKFVPSTNSDPDQQSELGSPAKGAGDRYLAIVLDKKRIKNGLENDQPRETPLAETTSETETPAVAVCDVCRLPIPTDDDDAEGVNPKPHETSLAHQVCLEHSHPPSHLDRSRQGLKYLSSYGWDPDARQGLGATGAGIRIPIKSQPKNDSLGLGLLAPLPSNKIIKHPLKKLDAKQTRKGEAQMQRDRQKLREMFYQHEDVDKYLGSNG